jgi:hypothetical protein
VPAPIHTDFRFLLELKQKNLIDLYTHLREFVIYQYPECNEILYHTHALTSVYSISEKLSDAYCIIPVYSNHLNLGFNKGTLLKDPHKLLQGTGNLMRHIPIQSPSDYNNKKVKELLKTAINFALEDLDTPAKTKGQIISKIKR